MTTVAAMRQQSHGQGQSEQARGVAVGGADAVGDATAAAGPPETAAGLSSVQNPFALLGQEDESESENRDGSGWRGDSKRKNVCMHTCKPTLERESEREREKERERERKQTAS